MKKLFIFLLSILLTTNVFAANKKEEQCTFKTNDAKIFSDIKGSLNDFSKSGSTVGLGDSVVVKKHVNEYVNANVLDGHGREYLKNVFIKSSDLDCAMY